MPSKRKEIRQEKQKKRRGEKTKRKCQVCCVTVNPNSYLKILLSAHARISETNILHLDQNLPNA